MEEQALYRAILANPHDDTARLVYADWLDENADRFPDSLARSERARAEFIRVQCALARAGPGGWNVDAGPPDAELAKRQKRLHFRCGAKWRRAFPVSLRTARFDRGFLRPRCAMRPQDFLTGPSFWTAPPYLALPADSPVRRYAPDGDPFAVCPLWDVHLYAPDYSDDSVWNDRGQYGELLADVARSPALARIGWLQVSFFRTSAFELLRAGNFANVETLVVNCGPFPQVLEAVTENESFLSLRYVWFGDDRWAWGNTATAAYRSAMLRPKLAEANGRHLPHGEMRGVLRELVREAGAVIVAPPVAFTPALTLTQATAWMPEPLPEPTEQFPTPTPQPQNTASPPRTARPSSAPVFAALVAAVLLLYALVAANRAPPPKPPVKFDYNPDRYKVPPAVYEVEKWKAPPAAGVKPSERRD